MSTLAHLLLAGRHRHTIVVGGLYWRYCSHRSHRLRLPCWRWATYDSQCPEHNQTCFHACPEGS